MVGMSSFVELYSYAVHFAYELEAFGVILSGFHNPVAFCPGYRDKNNWSIGRRATRRASEPVRHIRALELYFS